MDGWTDRVRTALSEHLVSTGSTIYRVSQDTGISTGKLHGFLVDKKNLSAPNLEILAKNLGFRLTRSTPKTISRNG